MPKPADKDYLKGFTLLELLVVIAIIGVLVTIGTFGVRGALQRARDSERKSDLSQYRNALESFANNSNGVFPVYTALTCLSPFATLCGATNVCTDLELTNCPEDPSLPADANAAEIGLTAYKYVSNPLGTEYVLTATLEGVTNTFWMVCSNGSSGEWDSFVTSCPF